MDAENLRRQEKKMDDAMLKQQRERSPCCYGATPFIGKLPAELPTEWVIIYSNSGVKMQIMGLGA